MYRLSISLFASAACSEALICTLRDEIIPAAVADPAVRDAELLEVCADASSGHADGATLSLLLLFEGESQCHDCMERLGELLSPLYGRFGDQVLVHATPMRRLSL